MSPTDHVRQMFAAFDSKDVSALAAFMTDDVRLRLGSAEPVQGESAFVEAVNAFLASVAGFRHEVLNVWSDGDALIAEFDVQYTRLDGGEAFPAATCSGSGTAWLRSTAATLTPRPCTPDAVVSGVEVIVAPRSPPRPLGARRAPAIHGL